MTSDEYSRIEGGQVVGEAILFMRSRPKNADGSIGFIVKPDMPEWLAWEAYFEANGMERQLSFMRIRGMSGYTVPCPNPTAFDSRFRGFTHRRVERKADLMPGDREAVVARVMAKWTARPRSGRYTADDMREAKPAMPEPRPMTEAEIASMKRLIGEPA